MAKNLGGFPSIFRNKKGGSRYNGTLRKIGSAKFEQARARLSKLAGQRATDADVMEYLAIGEEATREYLAGKA